MKKYSFILACFFIISCAPATEKTEGLTKADIDELQNVHNMYREGWLKNDSAMVLSTFCRDAILTPPGKQAKSISGIDAIKKFWFSGGDTTYPIKTYTNSNTELYGAGNYAYISGTSDLTWDTKVKNQVVRTDTSRSEFLSVWKKENNQWRIYRQIWNVR